MTLLVPDVGDAPPAVARRQRHRSAAALFVALLFGYGVVGTVLVFGFDSIMEDALSRLSAASSVWSAHDPKLAAIGFVWTPLPALLMVPFTPLRVFWPELVSSGYLAVILSVTAMAASVCVLRAILVDLRVRRGPRRVLTGLFALQPLLLVYATNGMTEAILILFTLLATQRLMSWVDGGATSDGWVPDGAHLVTAGLFLALGYLARYEAIVATAAVTMLVMAMTALRARGKHRWHAVLADGLLVAFVPVAAFVIWAIVSWAVVGSPFEQFTSQYGNSALLAGGAAGGAGGMVAVGRQLLLLAPSALPVVISAALVAVRRRDPAVLVPLTVFGSVLSFEWLLHLSGNLFGFLRYQIAVIPMLAVLVGYLLSTRSRPSASLAPTPSSAPGRLRAAAGIALTALVLGSAIATSGVMLMAAPVLASQEYLRIRPAVLALVGRPPADHGANGMWAGDRELAARLDAMDLPDASVLADTGAAFALVAASRHPSQFLITSDDGFAAALADPPGHGVRYVLRNERGAVDSVRRAWPGLGTPSGPAWARLAGQATPATVWSYTWTLWKVGG